jgi:hypothetical protein
MQKGAVEFNPVRGCGWLRPRSPGSLVPRARGYSRSSPPGLCHRPITSRNAARQRVFSAVVPTEMRIHSGN